MKILRLLDIATGALLVLIAMGVSNLWDGPASDQRTTVTMRLDNGNLVHRNETLEICKRWQAMLALGNSSHGFLVQVMPWGTRHQVTEIWCGTFWPEDQE